MEINPVTREMAKLVIGLAGQSGDGKTRSALELAYGLADFTPSKIGVLDTENRRASLFCDLYKGRQDLKGDHRFLIGEMVPPFSPKRYIDSMRQFAEKGVDVLVIDSISHEFEGEGGIEEIANKAVEEGKKMADWNKAKREHKRFMNTLLFLPMHVIACVRAREKTDFRNPAKPVSMGIQPITEKNVMFEMTMSFLLSDKGRKRETLKLPDEYAPLVGVDGYITAQHGKNLRDWIGGVDPIERAKNALRLAASNGTESLKNAWVALSKDEQRELTAFKDSLKDLASHSDSEKKDENGEHRW